MLNSQIISDVLDKCGEPVKHELDAFLVQNEVMTEIDKANLELIQSGRGRADYKVTTTFAAGSRTGTIVDTNFQNVYDECWRVIPGTTPQYAAIAIYDDFEDLQRAEADGPEAIIFTGIRSNQYELSFTPTTPLTVELRSQKIVVTSNESNLDDENDLPSLFQNLIVARAAYKCLTYLLHPDVKKDYSRFVAGRKADVAIDLDVFEARWLVFRSGAADDDGLLQRRFYDPIEDMMSL